MEITYLGHSCFRIIGKNLTCVTDPFSEDVVGLKLPKLIADVVIVTHKHAGHSDLTKIKDNPLVLDGPGEYEVQGSEFKGILAFHDEKRGEERGRVTLFTFEIDDIRICHLSDLGSELDTEQLEEINGVDVLMIPCGGVVTINSEIAAKLVSEIEPKIVIPMHYRIGKMTEFESVE
ncbi:MAG: lactamase, partial [Candidatus Aenigmarchaeota archaeon]|nr:lactamase [Candidatus Aenigmarchaeota archaeon]